MRCMNRRHRPNHRVVLLVAAALIAFAGPAAAQSDPDAQPQQTVSFGFDFFPYVGTSSALPDARREVSLNLVGGLSGGTDKAELGSVLNINTGTMSGAQLAGAANWVTADVEGVQLAGSVNVSTGGLQGMQGAGSANIVLGGVNGIQFGGAGNVVSDNVNGLQGAGALNVVVGEMNGIQASGAANVVTQDMNGIQLGVFNVTAGDVSGVQLGIVNYARASTASIGLLSIVPQGFTDIEVFTTVEGLALTGLRHGTERIYNVYYAGSLLTPSGADLAYGLGLGWRWHLGRAWEVNFDGTATQVVVDGDFDTANVLSKLRALGSYRFSPAIAVFAGPTFTLFWSEDVDGMFDYLELWSSSHGDGEYESSAWFGGTIGVRIL